MDAPLETPTEETSTEPEDTLAEGDRDALIADELRDAIRRKVRPGGD
jgi:hypothetical protein